MAFATKVTQVMSRNNVLWLGTINMNSQKFLGYQAKYVRKVSVVDHFFERPPESAPPLVQTPECVSFLIPLLPYKRT